MSRYRKDQKADSGDESRIVHTEQDAIKQQQTFLHSLIGNHKAILKLQRQIGNQAVQRLIARQSKTNSVQKSNSRGLQPTHDMDSLSDSTVQRVEMGFDELNASVSVEPSAVFNSSGDNTSASFGDGTTATLKLPLDSTGQVIIRLHAWITRKGYEIPQLVLASITWPNGQNN